MSLVSLFSQKSSKTLLLTSMGACALMLQACSTVDSGIAKTIDTVGEMDAKVRLALVEIEVQELDAAHQQKGGFVAAADRMPGSTKFGKQYVLSRAMNTTATEFDNRTMHLKSKQLCESGYVKLSEQALAKQSLKDTTYQCATEDCRFQLSWQIRCQEVPEQPFSFFGKS